MKLNGPTQIFDACGAYDIHNGGDAISKGSKFPKWQDALSFIEWYGIPLMSGFGIIIIDDRENSKEKYSTLPGETEKCFQKAIRIASSAVSAALLTYTLIF